MVRVLSVGVELLRLSVKTLPLCVAVLVLSEPVILLRLDWDVVVGCCTEPVLPVLTVPDLCATDVEPLLALPSP